MTERWVSDAKAMKTQPVSLVARAGALTMLVVVAIALGVFVLQCLYWLRFDSWFDWSDPNGPRFPGSSWSGGPWKGMQAFFDLIVTAPVQLFASVTGLILVVLYVWVRSPSRK